MSMARVASDLTGAHFKAGSGDWPSRWLERATIVFPAPRDARAPRIRGRRGGRNEEDF